MSYLIAGRAIKSEWLTIGTLLTTASVAAISMSGGSKKEAAPTGDAGAVSLAKEQGKFGSSEEEEFIKNFVAEAEKSEKH